MITKETVLKSFNYSNNYYCSFTMQSNEYKVFKPFLIQLVADGFLKFIHKIKTKYTYHLLRCYSADLRIKQHCKHQCVVCEKFQKTSDLTEKTINDFENNKHHNNLINPSKLTQIIKILKK